MGMLESVPAHLLNFMEQKIFIEALTDDWWLISDCRTPESCLREYPGIVFIHTSSFMGFELHIRVAEVIDLGIVTIMRIPRQRYIAKYNM